VALTGCCGLLFCAATPAPVVPAAARACKVDAERLCNNTWLVGAALDGSIISCLRCALPAADAPLQLQQHMVQL